MNDSLLLQNVLHLHSLPKIPARNTVITFIFLLVQVCAVMSFYWLSQTQLCNIRPLNIAWILAKIQLFISKRHGNVLGNVHKVMSQKKWEYIFLRFFRRESFIKNQPSTIKQYVLLLIIVVVSRLLISLLLGSIRNFTKKWLKPWGRSVLATAKGLSQGRRLYLVY